MALAEGWDANSQFRAHRIKPGEKVATRKVLGINPETGQPESFFHYNTGRDSTGIIEITVDLYVVKERKEFFDGKNSTYRVDVGLSAVQFLCPRCKMGLLVVNSLLDAENVVDPQQRQQHEGNLALGNAYPIHLHWDQMTESPADGQVRPKITIEAPIRCDYSWHEIDGVAQPPHGVHSRCGFVGMLDHSRMVDHQTRILTAK